MGEIKIRREILMQAETVGDVAKWIAHVEGLKGVRMTTPLMDVITLSVQVDDELKLPGDGR